MREDRPALILKLAASVGDLHHDIGAQNIRRHQIGGELDAIEAHIEHLAQSPHQERLAQTRHALQQHMPSAEDGLQCPLHNLVMPYDDFADLGAKGFVGVAKQGDLIFGIHLRLARAPLLHSPRKKAMRITTLSH